MVYSFNSTKMKDLVSVQRTGDKGLGIFALRDIKKDEIITEFSGPVVTIPEFDGFPGEVIDHLFNIGIATCNIC